MLNDLYAAAFLRLSCLWKRQHGTIADAGFFLKGLSSLVFLYQLSLVGGGTSSGQQPQNTSRCVLSISQPNAKGCNAQEIETFPV